MHTKNLVPSVGYKPTAFHLPDDCSTLPVELREERYFLRYFLSIKKPPVSLYFKFNKSDLTFSYLVNLNNIYTIRSNVFMKTNERSQLISIR